MLSEDVASPVNKSMSSHVPSVWRQPRLSALRTSHAQGAISDRFPDDNKHVLALAPAHFAKSQRVFGINLSYSNDPLWPFNALLSYQ